MSARVIETERLVLRPPVLADFAGHDALWQAPEVLRFIAPEGFTAEDRWTRFLRIAGCWSLMGFGYFSVLDRAEGAYLGQVGFQEGRREITPSIAGSLEMGWVLGPQAHGRGLGREAAGAALGWARSAFAGRRASAFVALGNARSLRLAAELGFAAVTDTAYHGAPVRLFARTL